MSSTLTSWAVEGRYYRRSLRAARAAGRRGDPDPAASRQAASCFAENVALYRERAAHLTGDFIKEQRANVVFLAEHRDLLDIMAPPIWDGRPTTLGEELGQRAAQSHDQLVRRVRGTHAALQLDFSHHTTQLDSVVSAWMRHDAKMKDRYRSRYLFRDFVDRLAFPVLDLSDLDYRAGGVDLRVFLEGPGPEPAKALS